MTYNISDEIDFVKLSQEEIINLLNLIKKKYKG